MSDDIRADPATYDTGYQCPAARKPSIWAIDRVLTASGQWLDLRHPDRYAFTVAEIAHALSLVCRFNGQCTRFYSVGQHSLHVHSLLRAAGCGSLTKLHGLLHDAAEAYIGDMTRGVKPNIHGYQELEDRLHSAILFCFHIPPPNSSARSTIKSADNQALLDEWATIIPLPMRDAVRWAEGMAMYSPNGLTPFRDTPQPWHPRETVPPEVAEAAFTATANSLLRCLTGE